MFAAAAILLGFVALLLVLPVWAFADASAHGPRERLFWRAAVVLLWPLGSLVYGLFRPRSRLLWAGALVVASVQAGLVWVGRSNAERESGTEPPTLAHYDGLRETRTLRLADAFGSYGSAGNDDYVQALSLSGDGGRVLVSGGRSLVLWDVFSGRPLRTFERLPANDILAGWLHGKWLGRPAPIALSSSGDIVAAARGSVTLRVGVPLLGFLRDAALGRDHVIEVWRDGRKLELRAHDANVTAIQFADDRLVSFSYDGSIAIWDLERGTLIRRVETGQGWIRAGTASPDGRLAAVSAREPYGASSPAGHLGLWDLETGDLRAALTGHEEPAHALAFTEDGGYLLSAGFDGIRRFDAATGREVSFVPAEDDMVRVSFSRDGRYALSGAQTLALWDLETGTVFDRIPLGSSEDSASATLFGPDGRTVLVGTTRGAILKLERKDAALRDAE